VILMALLMITFVNMHSMLSLMIQISCNFFGFLKKKLKNYDYFYPYTSRKS
jgi:hypothetical protein